MTFTCIHCDKPIHGVAAVFNKKFIHHRCMADYQKANAIREKWEASGLLESLKNSEDKINLANLLDGKAKQILPSE